MEAPARAPHPVRAAAVSDASELARLLTLLGHPTAAEDITQRWSDWHTAGNSALVVPAAVGGLAAAVTLHRMTVLHRPHPVGRITALIVDEPGRGRGMGRTLVGAAEAALAEAGCGLLEITSNVRFALAHTFYEHLGYQRTSVRFAKTLVAPPPGAPLPHVAGRNEVR